MYSSKKGEENEIKYKSDIEKVLKCNLDLTTKFHTFDYENKDEKH